MQARNHHPVHPRRAAACAAGLLALALASGSAVAQTSPYYFGASLGFSHDSNIYQNSKNAASVGDTVWRGGLFAGIDQPFGRQRAYAKVSVDSANYRDNNLLDNTGYALNLGLDWSTIERLSGSLSVNSSQSQAPFNTGDSNGEPIRIKNLARTQGVNATVRMGVVTRMTIEGSIGHQELSYTAAEYAPREHTDDTLSLGLRYTFSGALTAGVGLRHNRGRYPNYGPALVDRYKGNNIDFSADYTPTGTSTLNARISLGNSRHTEARASNYSGLTGAAGWNWRPGGRISVSTSFTRDLGTDIQPYIIGKTQELTSLDSSTLTNTLATRVNYELTAKIGLNAGLAYSTRRVDSALAANRISDDTTTFSLGANWAATRVASLGCNLARVQRSSSNVFGAYDTNSFGCSGQVRLQ